MRLGNNDLISVAAQLVTPSGLESEHDGWNIVGYVCFARIKRAAILNQLLARMEPNVVIKE